ncbi:MAG: hypothetical protein AAGH67_06015 [Cyanobacteria bacterium P01_H01_bin.162]
MGGALQFLPSLHTFALYDQRFGGIKPHFKDYKLVGFQLSPSRRRSAQLLTTLVMFLDIAHLIAMVVGVLLVRAGKRRQLDW